MRESSMPDVDEALLQTFKTARNCNVVHVSKPMHKAKADGNDT